MYSREDWKHSQFEFYREHIASFENDMFLDLISWRTEKGRNRHEWGTNLRFDIRRGERSPEEVLRGSGEGIILTRQELKELYEILKKMDANGEFEDYRLQPLR